MAWLRPAGRAVASGLATSLRAHRIEPARYRRSTYTPRDSAAQCGEFARTHSPSRRAQQSIHAQPEFSRLTEPLPGVRTAVVRWRYDVSFSVPHSYTPRLAYAKIDARYVVHIGPLPQYPYALSGSWIFRSIPDANPNPLNHGIAGHSTRPAALGKIRELTPIRDHRSQNWSTRVC
jgi:hypothetical protein